MRWLRENRWYPTSWVKLSFDDDASLGLLGSVGVEAEDPIPIQRFMRGARPWSPLTNEKNLCETIA